MEATISAETRNWLRRELDRRRREEPVEGATALLLPPEDFSDEYAPEDPTVRGDRGPNSTTVRSVLASACAGWGKRPDAAEFYEAIRSPTPTDRQEAIVNVMVIEATCNEILLAYLQGAYTWRQLARAIQRCGNRPTRLSRYVNLWAKT